MSLPPVRISIKRRRQDDPVDTLYLEVSSTQDHKRRFTDFCFHRLRHDQEFSESKSQGLILPPEKQQATSNQVNSRIPLVRATAPGDEVKETLKLKNSHRENQKVDQTQNMSHQSPTHASSKSDQAIPAERNCYNLPDSESESTRSSRLNGARRFHLTRDTKISVAPKEPRGVQKFKSLRNSHVAIFVERLSGKSTGRRSIAPKSLPADWIVELLAGAGNAQTSKVNTKMIAPTLDDLTVSKETNVAPFKQPPQTCMRQGTSIRDPPSTWDHSSDQLADELAALALEFDAEHRSEQSSDNHDEKMAEILTEMIDAEFIYDTYLRAPLNHESSGRKKKEVDGEDFGVLVIDEDSSNLWQTYFESEEDTEWDEEDADSNAEDNPANDYPEDEVSSEDEFGYRAYSHRKNGSDDDEYDFEGNCD